MGKSLNPMTFIASVEIAQKLRVAIKPGTTTLTPEVIIAGADQAGIGINDVLVALGDDAAVNIYNKSGSLEMVASGAISVGDKVYPAAGGKVTKGLTFFGQSLGICISEATGDGDIIEVVNIETAVVTQQVKGVLIPVATGSTNEYITAPTDGSLMSVMFQGEDALAASDTNYITWTVTNLDADGLGSTVMLKVADGNTTKATGGYPIVADALKAMELHATAANLIVSAGDRLRITATVTGTLANTVDGVTYTMQFGS